jgi:hypothetical protein
MKRREFITLLGGARRLATCGALHGSLLKLGGERLWNRPYRWLEAGEDSPLFVVILLNAFLWYLHFKGALN